MAQQYLGPTLGVVTFSTWPQLVEAAEGGLLEESGWCELKEMATRPGSSKKDANLEMARDLASLSVDGGILIYGVRDKDLAVVGCDTTGLADRIAQVSATRITPPLSPAILPSLENPDDDSLAVLIVQVPPSPLAPHMVDQSYWGRSSNGKRKLEDAEVRRLLLQRDRGEDAFRTRLIALEDHDPLVGHIQDHPTGNGHVYLVAEPTAPVARDDGLQEWGRIRDALRHSGRRGTVADCMRHSPHPAGEAYATVGTNADPQPAQYERRLCHVLIQDDGSIEVVSGGGTAEPESPDGTVTKYLDVGLVSTLTVQTLQMVEGWSKAWGYTGTWRVGLRVTNTFGAVRTTHDDWLLGRPSAFKADEYVATTVMQGIGDESLDLAQPLLKGLYRGLGMVNEPINEVAN